MPVGEGFAPRAKELGFSEIDTQVNSLMEIEVVEDQGLPQAQAKPYLNAMHKGIPQEQAQGNQSTLGRRPEQVWSRKTTIGPQDGRGIGVAKQPVSGLATEGWKRIPVAHSDLSQWQVVGRKHSAGIPSGVQGHERPLVSTINRFGGLIESAILPGQRVVNIDFEASCSHDLGGMERQGPK
ncbi:hypothetical protein Dimus_012850 [Dionaea muscipula]